MYIDPSLTDLGDNRNGDDILRRRGSAGEEHPDEEDGDEEERGRDGEAGLPGLAGAGVVHDGEGELFGRQLGGR